MTNRINRRSLWLVAVFSFSSIASQSAGATIVQFQTVMGDFEVNLYDNTTPATVANFLAYLNSGAYTRSVFHRSVPGFIVQGGGFTFDMALPLNGIPANAAVVNEPELSNVRGTIAMAKLGNDPNSATSQWFFNLSDNSTNLNVQNEGFTVFGEVVGNGMTVVDAIAALQTFGFAGALGELPLRDYSDADFANNVDVEEEHLALITVITIFDSTVDSAAGLNPPANTSNPGGGGSGGGLGSGGGGGSLGFWAIFMLLAMLFGRQVIRLRT